MRVDELKSRLKVPTVTVCTPSACGFKPAAEDETKEAKDEKPAGEVTDDEADDEEDMDDLLCALMFLAEAEDALSSIIKLDKRDNFLSFNHAKDIVNLMGQISEFTAQYATED